MSSDFGDTTRIQSCLDRWRAGDNSARKELLERVQQRLFRLARVMLRGFPKLRNTVDTADVAMEVNLKLWQALPKVRPASVADFMRWAATRMRWQLIDWARRNRRLKPTADASYLPVEVSDSTVGPATLALWTEFHELIEQLEPESRVLFDLLYYGGLTQAEAAQELGVSLSTLKKRWKATRLFVYRALNK